jgi:hypothetical protein
MKAGLSEPLWGFGLGVAYTAAFFCAALRDGLVIEWAAAGISGLGAILFLVRMAELGRPKPLPQDKPTEP